MGDVLTPLDDIMYDRKKEITFIVKGAPTPQGRPIFSRRSGSARDPEKSKMAKEKIKTIVEGIMLKKKFTKCGRDMPVRITVQAFKKTTTAMAKWMKFSCNEGWIAPTKQNGDADNILKLLFDAMNGVVYEDDAQIFSVSYECRYSDKERTEVKVEGYYVNLGAIREEANRLIPIVQKKKA